MIDLIKDLHPDSILEDLIVSIEELAAPENTVLTETVLQRFRDEINSGNKTIGEVLSSGNKYHLLEALQRLQNWIDVKGNMISKLGYGKP